MTQHAQTSQRESEEALDTQCINTIRFLSVDAVQKADSGHPGMPLGAAPMAYVLWNRFLKHNPANPEWFDRDRFVLSAGHGSMLLYSLLHLTGYNLPLEQIKNFREWGSHAPGHPERGMTAGVEVTTGPLGQGFGNTVGMAMAEAHLAAMYNRPNFEIINHFTYVIASDGDLMEGVASEAASLAGHLKLGKLVCLYDNNNVTLSAGTDIAFTEDVARRFESYGWHIQSVTDGNDVTMIADALEAARQETQKPSLILVTTHLGYGSPNKQDSFKAHGSPLGADEVKLTKQKLGWPTEPPFYMPEQALTHFREAVPHGKKLEKDWQASFEDYKKSYPDLGQNLLGIMQGELPSGWDADIPVFPTDTKGLSTRVAGGKIMNAISNHLPALIGGSADLNPSTFTALSDKGDFEPPITGTTDKQGAAKGLWDYSGRNIYFGVREHGMGAVLNGLASHGGTIPFGATFLIFSDYMRPPIRLAALMKLHVIYVFTHDSLALGQDGPTHQPVEQLLGLRSVPDLITIRPSDANETAMAWRVAIETKDRPVALIMSRQNLPTLDRKEYAAADGLRHGAYILADAPGGKPDIILIATGSEVHLAVEARKKLQEQKIMARVVSMPSWELFNAEPQNYRDAVLPPDITVRLAIEAGSPLGWHRYVGTKGDILGVDHFGASAPGEVVMREYGFTVENVCKKAMALCSKS